MPERGFVFGFHSATESTAPTANGAGRRPCRRRSSTPTALPRLPSNAVTAARRLHPQSAAMVTLVLFIHWGGDEGRGASRARTKVSVAGKRNF